MPEIKLKPCPFCGGVPITRITVVRGISEDKIRYLIGCGNYCIYKFADIDDGDSFEEAKLSIDKAI